jgi:hypothetical protein
MPPNFVLLSTSLHPCSRRSSDLPESPPVRSRNSPVHAGELASAGPRDVRRVLRSTPSTQSSPLTFSVVIPLRALRPRSRTNAGLNHRGPFNRRAVTLTPISLARRRLPSESIRAPLPFGRSRAPRGGGSSRISDTSRITPLRCDRWSLFAVVGSRSVLLRVRCSHWASPCPRHASPPCSEPSRDASIGPRPEHPTSAVRFSTHGHTRSSSRSSSARGCRLCPRSLAPTRLAPSRCDRLGLHDSPSEEPCSLRPSPATDLSAVALAKLVFTLSRASRDARQT